jgi:hypothetical protein
MTKFVIVASVLVYVTGFVVAVRHYAKCGVPVSALTHDVFLAAGALFSILGLVCGLSAAFIDSMVPDVMAAFRKRPIAMVLLGFSVILLPLLVAWLPVMALTEYDSPGSAAAFMGVVVVSSLLAFRLGPGSLMVLGKAPFFVLTFVAIVTIFSSSIYSRTPHWFGGSRPIVLSARDPREGALVPEETQARCAFSPLQHDTRCRTIFLVYWNETSVYMAVTEMLQSCPNTASHTPRTWEDDVANGARLCFVRVPAASFSPLRIPGHLPDPY